MPFFFFINKSMAEQIDNINYLQPNGFKVTISRENYAAAQYFAQSISHPNVDAQVAEAPYKRLNIPMLPDKLDYGALTIDFLMNEDMQNYIEIYNWLERMVEEEHNMGSKRYNKNTTIGRPVTDNSPITSYNDIVVDVLTSQNNINKSIKYLNAFPISLGNVEFNATSAGDYITFPVTFRFDYFTIG